MLSDGELTRDEMDDAWALNRAEGVAHAAARKMAWWLKKMSLRQGTYTTMSDEFFEEHGLAPWPGPEPTGEGD